MAPVLTTVSTTGKTWIAAGFPSTTVSYAIQQAAQAWVTAINNTGVIRMVGFNQATTWSANPTGIQFHVNDAVAGGNSGMGIRFYKSSATATTINYSTFYGWSAGTANNGYGTLTDANNTTLNTWGAGDGYQFDIVYCADPGDQYFIVSDSQYDNQWGLVRLNRPAGYDYPSLSLVSEWALVQSSSYIVASNGPSTSPGWGSASTAFLTPSDNWYMWREPGAYTRSLFVGTFPPGVARLGGAVATRGTTFNNGGTETYFVIDSPNGVVRTAL